MRKRLWIVILLLMISIVPGFRSALAADEDYDIVRVKLSVETTTALSFFLDGNYTIDDGSTAIERQQYTVKLEGGSLNMYCGSVKITSGSSIKLVQCAPTSGRNNFIWFYNAYQQTTLKYIGDMEFRIDTGKSCIEVINHLYIEDYLCGVVPWEMSSSNSFPIEALKAQAIAARNYTERNLRPSANYDVVDTTKNQVYKGYDPTRTTAIQAVNDTAGKVLTFEGGIIEVFYSASNGGYTEIPQHYWTATNPLYPYQVIQQDPYDVQNPYSKQDVLILPKSVTETDPISYAYSDDVGGMISVISPESSQIINAVAFLKDSALPAAAVMGYSSVDTITGITSIAAHTLQTQHDIPDYYGNLCVCNTNADISMTVLATRPGTAEEVAAGQATMQEPITVSFTIDMTRLDDKDGGYFVFDEHPSLGLFTIEETATSWNICHRRFGQGVGLSQRGAEQRARDGQTYQDILYFYYPGTIVAQQTYARTALPTATAFIDHSNASVNLTDSTPLKVRSGPGTTYSILDYLRDDARIEIVQANAATGNGYSWHKILYGGQYGYVAANYVLLDVPQPAVQTCTVTYVTNGGSAVSGWTGNHGASIAEAPAVSKTGYNFGGWYFDSAFTAQAAFPTIVTGDMSLYAKWDIASYTISYNLSSGTASNPASYTVNDTITLSNPTRPGYNFTGWSGTGISGTSTNVTIPAASTGNRAYTANWVSTACTVAFDAQGGSGVASVQKNLGESIASSPATARPGYTFGGWFPTSACNTAPVSFPYTVAGSVTFYAKWNPLPQTAYLSSIGLSAGSLNRAFSRTSYSYKVTLSEYEGSVTITPFRENDTAAMTINGKAVGSYTVSLANGKSTTVSVKVKFGRTTKTYKITVTRTKSTNNNLATLTATAGTFDRAFDPAVTSYTLTLDQFIKSVKIYDSVASPLASASFKSKTVSLSNGQTTKVTIVVKAQSGAKKTYTITVTRAPSTDTSLKYLKTNSSSCPLTPVFNPGIPNYTITLPANRSYVTISAKALGYKAAVYFDGSKRSSKKVTLANGQSITIHVVVVAQAGNTADYYITVTRQ